MAAKQINYQKLQAELDQIMHELQREDIDVDEALKAYERGLSIIKDLEQYLGQAENRVREIKAKFAGEK
ncbi:MAG TPA: exodeoxyribonuclease VII small subunit [Candidatus Dormibacteraeota bacterium]|nr:exodeoxyribonuclease VII small subunit [Candidatus Dormibacteraeota bacterium]